MNAHTALGIAQIVFYVPVAPLAIWLMIRNGSVHPRMAWWPFIPFSLMRLAGGPVVIALEKNPYNVGLVASASVLLNVGIVPLIVATWGFLRIVIMDNYKPDRLTKKCMAALRLAMVSAVALLAAGAGTGSSGDSSARTVGRILLLVGYVVFVAVLFVLVGAALYFWSKRLSFVASSHKVLLAILATGPFLVIRSVYGILQVAFEYDAGSVWDPLYGSTLAFALMALLAEYIALVIFFYVGFSMPPDRGVPRIGSAGEDDAA